MTRASWIAALFLTLLALLAPLHANAQTFPPLTGRVVDAADILPQHVEDELTQKLAALEQEKGQQFVVATIPSLEGRSIEDYGYQLGRAWGIGRKDVNDGVILIVAPNDRQVRIEVGYGLTPVLTAGLSRLIIEDKILPLFRAGDMEGGVVAGADEILAQLRLPARQAEARAQRIVAEQEALVQKEMKKTLWIVGLFFGGVLLFILMVFVIVFRGFGKSHRRGKAPVVVWGPTGGIWGSDSSSGWSSGSSGWSSGGSDWGGGGGFSGGGGSFGGGGASGSW